MMRNGNDERYENGGHNILYNPLLTAAIEEIRDGYFQYFEEKRFIRNHTEGEGETTKPWRERLLMVENELAVYNCESMYRLQQENYGFSQAKKTALLRKVKHDSITMGFPPLSETDAEKIVGSVIRHCIDAYHDLFSQIPRMGTPDIEDSQDIYQKQVANQRSAEKASGRKKI